MDSEPHSKPVDEDNSQPVQEADSSPVADNPPINHIDRDFLREKPPSSVADDDESIDESRDTTSQTSTRLVKFQLFETKTVNNLTHYVLLIPAILYPRIQSE